MTLVLRKKVLTSARVTFATVVVLYIALVVVSSWFSVNAKARTSSGRFALESGNYERAIRDLEFAIRYSNDSPGLNHLLGVAYIKRGEQLIKAISSDDSRYQRKLLDARYDDLAPSKAKEAKDDGKATTPPPKRAVRQTDSEERTE